MTIHLRADRAVFRFSGPDAHKLLNDVVTGHIPAEDSGMAAWWALLSPQGKILAEGLAGHAEDALLARRAPVGRRRFLQAHEDVPPARPGGDRRPARNPSRRLRARQEPAGHRPCRSARPSIGWRVIAPVAATQLAGSQDDSAYLAARIAAGISEQGADFPANDSLRPRYRPRHPRRHRLRQGLLCRPGSRQPHEASRHRPPPPGDRLGHRRPGRHAQSSPAVAKPARSARSSMAVPSPSCASTASPIRPPSPSMASR